MKEFSFAELVGAFKHFFAGTHKESDFRQGENWCYAVVKNARNDCVHYEIDRRGANYFIELHVECKLSKNTLDQLKNKFAEHVRFYTHFTYYSSNYWQTRMPISEIKDVQTDLKRIVEITETIFADDERQVELEEHREDQLFAGDSCVELTLPEVARLLRNGTLSIPGVQRGRVWNAERMAALWDSILRGFPIGSFSVRKKGTCLELLDGQQRANSIALGYREFPPCADLVDKEEAALAESENVELRANVIALETPILWIDLDGSEAIKGTEKQFAFFVNTASQPWGYDFSHDETKNVLLPTYERRKATEGMDDYHTGEEGVVDKPYPCELMPVRAKLPVPYSLFREFCESRTGDWGDLRIGDFTNWVAERRKSCNNTSCWKWLDRIENDARNKKIADQLVTAIRNVKMGIYCTDATNVDDYDIALYFTRIGKGGVQPSDEELAFSVLKSKLDDGFKSQIEAISRKTGMASAARLAQIAVRCFASDRNKFFAGNILEKAISISNNSAEKKEFETFIHGEGGASFKRLVEVVCDALNIKAGIKDVAECCGFSEWHLTRYCTLSSGSVMLFMLLEVKDFGADVAFDKRALCAAAELIANNGYNLERCCRFVRETVESDYIAHLQIGLAKAFRDSYRNNPMLRVPPRPETFDLSSMEFDEIVKRHGNKDRNLKICFDGYNYGSQRAYSVLLFSCKGALPPYVPYSAKWAEENCPWDYDHMLPHSWVERLGDIAGAEICRKVVNSIGNLSPLPYSLNRKISDDDRVPTYPYFGSSYDLKNKEVEGRQKALHIESNALAKYQKSRFVEDSDEGFDERKVFCMATIRRFSTLYKLWYQESGMESLLDYSKLKADTSVDKRRKILESVLALLNGQGADGFNIWYLGENSLEYKTSACAIDFYRYSWLTVGRVVGDSMVAFTVHSAGDVVEIGLRKAPDKESTTDRFYNELKAACPPGDCKKLPDGFERLEKQGEKFWYLYKDISPLFGKEDVTQYVAKELLNILAWVNAKGGNDVV